VTVPLLVVDTNVPAVAALAYPEASPDCVAKCLEVIRRLRDDRARLVLDDGNHILREYSRALSGNRQPDAARVFMKWVYDNRCKRAAVYARDPAGTDFKQLDGVAGIDGFDLDDRKFLAAALGTDAVTAVYNAVDSDWLDYRVAIEAAGVAVVFVCGEGACIRHVDT
jgi:hypothetical protein